MPGSPSRELCGGFSAVIPELLALGLDSGTTGSRGAESPEATSRCCHRKPALTKCGLSHHCVRNAMSCFRLIAPVLRSIRPDLTSRVRLSLPSTTASSWTDSPARPLRLRSWMACFRPRSKTSTMLLNSRSTTTSSSAVSLVVSSTPPADAATTRSSGGL